MHKPSLKSEKEGGCKENKQWNSCESLSSQSPQIMLSPAGGAESKSSRH